MDQFALFILLSIGGAGVLLFYLGWNRKRYPGGTYCSRCFYRVDTSGADATRCSECGADLTRHAALVPWQPNRQRSMIAIGILLFILGGSGIGTNVWTSIDRMDLLRLAPTWYLLRADVSAEDDFANDEVHVIRQRVLNGTLSPEQERRFTRVLCKRATNLHLDQRNQTMSYTGMTLNLLLLHKPPNDDVNALVDAIVTHVYRINDIPMNDAFANNETAQLALPTLDFDPVWPYLRHGELESKRMRAEVRLNAIEQNGVSLAPSAPDQGSSIPLNTVTLEKTIVQGDLLVENAEVREHHVRIDRTRLDIDKPIELELRVEWFIEDESTPIDEALSRPIADPWHVSTHRVSGRIAVLGSRMFRESLDENAERRRPFPPAPGNIEAEDQ